MEIRMMKRNVLVALCLGVLLLAASCATEQPSQPLVTLGPAKGEIALAMKADDYSFNPNNIKAYKGDVLVVRVENASNSGHNLTVTDPQGKTVQSVALPSRQTVTVKVDLSQTGSYEFYCDKPFHSGFGMKGRIQVE